MQTVAKTIASYAKVLRGYWQGTRGYNIRTRNVLNNNEQENSTVISRIYIYIDVIKTCFSFWEYIDWMCRIANRGHVRFRLNHDVILWCNILNFELQTTILWSNLSEWEYYNTYCAIPYYCNRWEIPLITYVTQHYHVVINELMNYHLDVKAITINYLIDFPLFYIQKSKEWFLYK